MFIFITGKMLVSICFSWKEIVRLHQSGGSLAATSFGVNSQILCTVHSL